MPWLRSEPRNRAWEKVEEQGVPVMLESGAGELSTEGDKQESDHYFSLCVSKIP